MIDLNVITQFMLENFEQVKITGGGNHFLARCILCGDSKVNPYKKRFNLDWNNGVPGWHCFNCGKHGNFIQLYSYVKGLNEFDAKKELFKWNDKLVARQFKKTKKSKPRKKVEEENFNFIKDKCYTLNDSGRYTDALKRFYEERKIPKRYKIYICYDGRYRNRIIIPVFNVNHDIIYFQARRIPGTGLIPKYDNPVAPKELVILNGYVFDKNKNIIVHEGLIDAFMVGNQGTSCLGKEISEELVRELLTLTNKDVIIALDNDSEAYKALAKFMKKNKYAAKVKYFLYPSEFADNDDINSIVRSTENNLDVYELITQNSVSYSTAYTKLTIFKMLSEGNKNENNKNRK